MAKPNAVRTRRGEETRRKIIEDTKRMLARSGSQGVTLDQVSEAVGVAKSSILWHFGSKEDLLLVVMEDVIREFEAGVVKSYPPDLPPLQKIRLFLRDYGKLRDEYQEALTIFYGSLFDRDLMERFRDRARAMFAGFRQAIVTHLSTPEAPFPEPLATAFLALLDGLFIQWRLDPDRVDHKEVFAALSQWLEALGPGREPAP
ncbi:MAG: TetR/AcrR family transcriptional regulator [Proteobacteria bacterium]|nr:TetR/AcrR family transcriptional regulator [Pseudomonadota bacterium]